MMMNDSDQLEDVMDNVVFDLKLELAGLVRSDWHCDAVKYKNLITKVEITRLPAWRTR